MNYEGSYGYDYDYSRELDYGPTDYTRGYDLGDQDGFKRGYEDGKAEGRRLALVIQKAIGDRSQDSNGAVVVNLDGETIYRSSELKAFVVFRALMREGLSVTLTAAPNDDLPF